MVREQCVKIRETLRGILSAKSPEDLATLCQEGKMLLMEMKDSTRQQSELLETLREETSAAKTELDSLNLVLQNLLYEKTHYEKEIRACQDFKSAYSDEDISLLSLEDYKKETGDAEAEEDHETMLRRLAHEIKRRKKLHARLQEVKTARIAAEAEEGKQRRFVKDLAEQLKGIDKAANVVKSQLKQERRGAMAFLGKSAELLPPPLYILYSQLAACIDAHGIAAEVSIEGSVQEAEAAAAASLRLEAEVMAASVSEDREPEAIHSRDVDMIDLDGLPASKKHKGKEEDAASSSSKDLYEKYPLSIVLGILSTDSSRSQLIGVVFHYLPLLNVVTAEAQDQADNIYLANLFPGDSGAVTPNEANSQLEGGSFLFDLSRPARPYRWAQHLAGLDFLPPVPPSVSACRGQSGTEESMLASVAAYRKQARHSSVLAMLRARKEGAAGLKAQLQVISKNMIPRAGQSPSIPQAQCKISVWKELAGTGDGSIMLLSGAYSRLLGAAAVAGSKEGVVSSCPSWAKEPGAVALQGLGSRLFRCVLRRGEVELEAQVEVTLEYPTRPPLFTLMHMQWPATEDGGCNAPMARLPKAELAALEAELNLGSVAVMSKRCPDAHQLLVQRLAALMSAFDLYVEQALSQRSLLASGLQTRVPATRGRELRRPLAGGDDFAQRA